MLDCWSPKEGTCKCIYIISLLLIIFTYFKLCFLSGRFPWKFERSCAVYVTNHNKTKNRRSGLPTRNKDDDSKSCPFNFVDHYDDPDIHNALANIRRLDGSPTTHGRYCPPVIFSPPRAAARTGSQWRHPCWVCFLYWLLQLYNLYYWFHAAFF